MKDLPTPPGTPIVQTPELTVVAEYKPKPRPNRKAAQTEKELEDELVKILTDQAYEPVTFKSGDELVDNLREKLERLNETTFSDSEWENFYLSEIANNSEGVREKTQKIQKDHIRLLHRDDGTVKNVYLIDKKDIHNNAVQVMRQFEQKEGTHENRYDVTILVNGLPLVQIELKRRGVALQEAFNQIKRYQRESFWSGTALFEYVQIYVISNGTLTKYYSNTTREGHFDELKSSAFKKKGAVSSKSFEFTSWWSDGLNRPIRDLVDFAKTFLAKRTLLSILTRFCVFTCDKDLMVMRPYQIAATEAILNRIKIAGQYHWEGDKRAGGYIWHTTGSGKTLTSFKTATLAAEMPEVDKVLFVVDRKDLDYQTIKEYDKFEKGAASSNRSTAVLAKQLKDPEARIIITTIQKLSNYVQSPQKNSGIAKKVAHQKIVIIFDECHRSQFGQMHRDICRFFKNHFMFGFTGTPIFATNAVKTSLSKNVTTEETFGDRLHLYTILNAINDKNVLGFKMDYVSTMKIKEGVSDENVSDIDREKALTAPKRIAEIVRYILENFDRKTYRAETYSIEKKRVSGFNSLFATSSIQAAKAYYAEFKKQQAELPEDKRLKVGIIYSYNANAAEPDDNGLIYDEDSDSVKGLDKADRDFLDAAIEDYNGMFQTSYGTGGDGFANYYKDISKRMKEKELDLLIVVDMFLTGFDAKTLNTLWVDKNLRYHGLLQAFSRTNRILNSVKQFGCVVCFRNLEEAVEKSLALFSDSNAGGIVFWRTYSEYYNGYIGPDGKRVKGYKELVEELVAQFPMDSLACLGESEKKKFVALFGTLLRAINVLNVFDEFTEPGQKLISPFDIGDYQSHYIDIYQELRGKKEGESVNINDDLVFEIELIKQTQVDTDYIITLISKYHGKNSQDKEILIKEVTNKIDSSPELRSKRDLILAFIMRLNPGADVLTEWNEFFQQSAEEELDQIIQEENLKPDRAKSFMRDALRTGIIQTEGTDFAAILPQTSFFSTNENGEDRAVLRARVADRLEEYLKRFAGLKGEDEE